MRASYIVRFDDVCPTMNWEIWERLEPALQRHHIKPILAVVPDNRDPNLAVGPPRADFWSRVRNWQAAGWTIGLHGHQHVYSTEDAGLVGINAFSEFAGLTEDAQRAKLRRALSIFEREGVRADAWVAPAHSFDAVTVKLLLEAGVTVISDGFYCRPVRYLGALWIPQQFWHFRPAPAGLWTVCYHHNQFDEAAIARFTSDMAMYADRIVGMPAAGALGNVAEHSILDRAFSSLWVTALRLKRRRIGA